MKTKPSNPSVESEKDLSWKLLLMALLSFAMTACNESGDATDHKIAFPASAANFQNRGNSQIGFLDRGIATLVVIDRKDLDGFLAQLKINERRRPAKEKGDPTVNGWNVWPQDARTFVPGNDVFSGFKKTWDVEPVPIEMLSCQSPAGDWLHVEIWNLSDTGVLLKIFTQWN
jgi:hypothetical protein